MTDCVFCKILAGELPGTFVHRDELCTALMDIQPVNPGHLMVIPNQHAKLLSGVSDLVTGHMMQMAHHLAAALRQSGLRCEGINIFLADGEAGGQEVPHVHLHVFPRFSDDGFGMHYSADYNTLPPREELEQAASSIRQALENDGPSAQPAAAADEPSPRS